MSSLSSSPGADSAQFVISPAVLDFGAVAVGQLKTGKVTVTNSRGAAATISQVTTSLAAFTIADTSSLPLVLAPGESSILTVAFKPTSSGPASSSLSFFVSGSPSPVTIEPLSGNGVASAELVVSPPAMDFGIVALGSSQEQTGSLTATTSSVTVSSATWKGAGYSLSGIEFPVTVPAGQSVPFVVTYAPQAAGSSAGSVSFDSDAADSPATEIFSGSGPVSAYTVALSWNPSPSNVAGYNIYRGRQSGGPYVLINSGLTLGTTFGDDNIAPGSTYFYVITAVDVNSQESDFSSEGIAAIP